MTYVTYALVQARTIMAHAVSIVRRLILCYVPVRVEACAYTHMIDLLSRSPPHSASLSLPHADGNSEVNNKDDGVCTILVSHQLPAANM